AMTLLGARILNTSSANRDMLRQDHLFAQLERLAADLVPDDPLLPLAEFMIWSARHMRARLEHQAERADAALGEMIRRADLVPAGHVARPFVLSGVATAHMERHSIKGELRNLEMAGRAINDAIAEAAAGGPFAEGTALHGYLLYLRGHLGAMRNVYNPDLPALNEAIDDLERAEAEFGPAEAARLGMITSLGTARFLREQLTSPIGPDMTLGPMASDTFDRLLEAAERAGRDSLDYPVLAGQAAAGLILRGLGARDVTLVDRAIALYADVCAIPTLGLRERPRALELHGEALHTRYSMTRDPRDLNNAIARLNEARLAVEQEPGSPHAGSVLQSLASAYRSRGNQALGDVDRAERIGLAGLRERAGDVLLQDSDDDALNVARQATNDATEMARWFLARGRDDAAISAIELGRGMVLHAATSGTGVAEALAEAGHRELALEWTAQATRPGPRMSGGPVPGGNDRPPEDDDLRYRAMLALESTPAEARLLSPPTVAGIAAALRSSGADALVYLLPQDDAGPGTAVLVDQAGTVSSLSLFQLRTGAGSPVAEFIRARRSADLAAVAAATAARGPEAARAAAEESAARADWLDALAEVCDWAWRTAAGRVLRTVPARDPRTPRRIVLVPGGELGLVPWHAARRPAGDGRTRGESTTRDYACRDAVISYASSARQFCDAVRRRTRPWPQAPVLISDSDISDYITAVGIKHLHAAHYATGAIFGYARGDVPAGVPGAAAAGRADVLTALPHGAFPGSSVLHFGCHGRVRGPTLASSLRLGTSPGGGEESVSVRDILRQSRTGQAHELDGGLVVLASCLSDVTEGDYDEALTLAAAFLAAGSTGVVAARWSVPSAETALFMAAFHRFLNDGHGDPAHALREAQLWMLNPGREVPGSWPDYLRGEASLDGQPDGPNLTSTEAWAGFTYQGR
ncbi:MAG TPA: CHAT domain-containing protein, partial [Trebonia sp.]|nr:CHAT domain-containing protein [Trebonia sp.]